MHIGYVVKRFPRYSETFVATGVQAPVRYLPSEGTRPADFWAVAAVHSDRPTVMTEAARA